MVKIKKMSLPTNIDGADIFLDVEATGLNVMRDMPKYLAWRLTDRYGVVHWNDNTIDWLNDNLPLTKRVCAHNAKYDCHMMIQGGVNPAVIDYSPIYCTMVGAQLNNEYEAAYTLDYLGNVYTKVGKVEGIDPAHISKYPIEKITDYANRDTLICSLLAKYQDVELARQDLTTITDIEMQVVKVLTRIERRGAPVFMDRAEQAVYAMRAAIDEADDEIWQMVGYRTNTRSKKALDYAFFAVGLPPMESYDKEHLEMIDHPIGQGILDFRQILTAQDVFVIRLQDFVGPDGRIHCNFNQNKHEDGGTHTGRLSATNPNLQQIPARVKRVAKVIRSMFGKRGYGWAKGDWNQFEFRIFGHFVGDQNVIDAYSNDRSTDFHAALASLTGIERSRAKRINLGLVFNMGEGKLAHMLNLPCTEYMEGDKRRWKPGPEAQALFARYHSKFPKARPYLKQSAREAESKGYIKSILGRRIRFPDRSKAYKAGGLRFQSSAADILKAKLIELDEALMSEGNGAELILTVHDEFDVLYPEGEKERTCQIMKEVMEDVSYLNIPVLAEISSGDDWWEASAT